MDQHAVFLGPGDELAVQKLRAIIEPKQVRQAAFSLELLEDPNQPGSGQGGVNLDRNGLPIVEGPRRPSPGLAADTRSLIIWWREGRWNGRLEALNGA